MLIYNNTGKASNIFGSNSRKNKKKSYKSAGKRKPNVIRTTVLKQKGQNKSKAPRKKLLKKNKQLLEGLGLQVKQ